MFSKPGAGANGMLIMLRSLGLEGVIEAAQRMSDAKTINKILEFADALPQITARLERIETYLVTGGAFAPVERTALPGPGGDVAGDDEFGEATPRAN